MALPKLFQRIFFHNNTTPALNEDNLNAMSKGLDDVDDRLINLAGTIMEDVPQITHDMEVLEPAIAGIASNVQRAETAATNAEDAKRYVYDALGIPEFYVDFVTGLLMYTSQSEYSFAIDPVSGQLTYESL